ncbi:MAG: hypothetical protein IJP68_06970, partial [Selenomonadaceae bacterium]|nr:hypothetical protein [Selenomonadaceae bacterium]
NNTDTGAITGSDAGGSTTKTAVSVIPETDSKKYPLGTTFTKQGLTVIIPEKIVDDSIGTKADKEFMISGLYSWWIEEGLKLIKESYGYSFSDNDAATQKITVKFMNNSATSWHAWIDYTNINDMSLNINMYYFHDVDTSNFNGKGTGNNNLLDRTIAHELTHAVMAAKVNNYSTLPLFLREGLAELVHGIDDERPNAIKQLIEIDYLDGDGDDFADFLNLTANKSGYGYEYAAGYILLRYLAKQAANSTIADTVNTIDNRSSNVSVIGGSGKDSVYNSGSYATISVGAGDDTVRNFGANAAVYGGAGNDSLYNDDDAVRSTINTGDGNNYVSNFGSNTKIIGGSGKDSVYNDDDCSSITITSGAGNDTVRNLSNSTSIDLGAGNDSVSNSGSFVTIKGGVGDDYIFNTGSNLLINYASGDGNDKIVGFNATSTLSISGSSYSTATSGNDLILTVGSNKITLSSAATLSAPKIISDAGNKPTEGNDSISNSSKGVAINLLGGNDTLRNYGASVTVNAGAGDDDVYNYSVSSGSSINCGTGADYVLNFANKVKIIGGAGNDSIRNLNSGYLDGKN